MRNIVPWMLGLGVVWVAGCAPYHRSPPRDDRTISRTGAAGEVEGRPTLGMPISVPGRSTVVIPFAVESRKGLFEKDDPYSREGPDGMSYDRSYYVSKSVAQEVQVSRGGQVRWHNAVVRDVRSEEEWTILNQRGIIGEWHMMWLPPKKDEPIVCRALVFVAVLDDTNKDGELDDRDARVAILTDADGRNPREITPRDGQVWGVRYDPEKDTVYLQVAKDTTGDGRITFEDAPVPYFAAVGSTAPAVPVSEAMRRKIEGLLK